MKIWNRKDCCSERLTGANVYVITDDGRADFLCGTLSNMTNVETSEIFCSNEIGTGVMIQVPGVNKTLTLCEVEVWGVYRQGKQVCYRLETQNQ